MASQDRATDARVIEFEKSRAKILSFSTDWDLVSKRYLEEVLSGLYLMTAYYSYGNGEISIENNASWHTLNEDVIISRINKIIKSDLDIQISSVDFPTRLWFEWE